VLSEAGVAITPASTSTPTAAIAGSGLSFAGSTETIAKAAERLGAFLKR